MLGFRKVALPLAVVGMNSIAVYWMYELLEGWLAQMLKIHLKTFDVLAHTSLVELFYGNTAVGAVWRQCGVVILIWLICLAMYRRRIFIRV